MQPQMLIKLVTKITSQIFSERNFQKLDKGLRNECKRTRNSPATLSLGFPGNWKGILKINNE
jgi:hypothetical protein